MKQLMRVLSFIAVIVFFAVLWRPLSTHAVANSISLAPSSQSGVQGSNFTVAVHEDSGTDAINGVQANLVYPTSMLKVVSVTVGSGWSEAQNNTSTPGSILFAAFPSPAGSTLTGDQALETVVFQAISPGTANITFGCNQSGGCPSGNAITRASDNTNILTSTVGASITISTIDQLASGQTLLAGQNLVSQNVRYKLAMQTDGNLVLYGNNLRPLWYSGTHGTGANRVVMQTDGNLVIYTAGNKAVWASGTNGAGVSSLRLQDDGNLVIYNNSSVPIWNSVTAGSPVFTYNSTDRLASTQTLQLSHYIKTADGNHALLMQSDGNLVLYGPGYHVLWATYTNGRSASYVVMQSDGNLVMYTAGNKPVWATGTDGRGASSAILQSDGNFVIYAGSTPTWASGTDGKL